MSKELIKTYGKGASLMLKMGYIPGTGLGDKGQGIVEPIMPSLRKRGEGIKVDNNNNNNNNNNNKSNGMNMMHSVIVDDWSDNNDEISSDDDIDINDENNLKIPLGFDKSGVYKSEYDLPEITDLVMKLKDSNIEIPFEIMEFIDSKNVNELKSSNYLQLRKNLYDILKNIQNDLPKVKFLKFEIQNVKKMNEKFVNDYNVLNEVYQLIKNYKIEIEKQVIVNKILNIKEIDNSSPEIKVEILKLVSSMLNDWWLIQVNNCNFNDINQFGDLLDLSFIFLSLSNKLGFENIIMKKNNDAEGKKIINIKFSILSSVILKPIIIKLKEFYLNWDIENVNLGIGIYKELEESEIINNNKIIELLILEKMILIKIEEYIDELDLNKILENYNENNEEFNFYFQPIIEWINICNDNNSDEIIKSIKLKILKKYKKFIINFNKDLNLTKLYQIGIYYWIKIFKDNEFNQEIEKSLLGYCVKNYREDNILNKNINSINNFFSKQEFKDKMKRFIEKMIHFKLIDYMNVIENEICIPFYICFLQIDKSAVDDDNLIENDFLRESVRFFSMNHLLDNEEKGFNCIINAIVRCYELYRFKFGENRGIIIGSLEDLILNLIKNRERDWNNLVNNAIKVNNQDKYRYLEELGNVNENKI